MQDELRRRVVEHPDDVDVWRVLGDFLQDRGDPRGSFIQTQLALEDPSLDERTRRTLRNRERELLDAHQQAWLGPLADALLDTDSWSTPRWQFRRGFLHTLDAMMLTQKVIDGLVGFEDRDLLRSLSVTYLDESESSLDALARLSFPCMRTFRFGDGTGSLQEEGRAAQLAAQMPRLEVLSVSGREVETAGLFGSQLPHLRSLTVTCAYEYATPIFARNRSFSRLEELVFIPHALEHDDGQDGYLPLDDVRTLVHGRNLKNLKRLELHLSSAGDQGVTEIVESGLLSHLEDLDLSYGTITNDGARQLAECPDIKNLRRLVLTYNRMTPVGVERLRNTGIPDFVAENQQSGTGADYLFFGDME